MKPFPTRNLRAEEVSRDNECRPESLGRWPDGQVERDWERSVFFQPPRLAELRRTVNAPRRLAGLLLAGLAGFAIALGDARGESLSGPAASGEPAVAVEDGVWVQLKRWWEDVTVSTTNDDGTGTGDPGTGEE